MPTSGVAINLRRHPHASLDDGVCATCSNVGRPPASAIPEPLPAAAQLSRVEGHRLAVERIEQPVVRIERAVPRNSTKAKAQQRRSRSTVAYTQVDLCMTRCRSHGKCSKQRE